jgi:glycosyltransferase involved in cell wall biosynthesis
VWFFGATAYLLPLLFAKLLGKTVVLQPRGDVPLTLQLHWEQRIPATLARFLSSVVEMLEKIGYRLANDIVTYTPAMAAELGLTRYEEKLHPNGARYIDTDQFYPHTEYTERDQIVGFLGRLDEEKGVRELANVAQQLPRDTKFVFAGDGDLHEWLETELANEIDTGSVEMMGWVDREEVPAVLSRFKLLVLPSQPTEGLPTVILEAFACGTPVYATPVSGVPDVIRNKETGFIMGNVDTEIIIEEITKIFTSDDLSQISKTGRQLIEDQYSFDAAVGRYRKILNDIQENE